MNTASLPQQQPRAWWREPMMWLVVGGPLTVVVAAIVTAVIAIRGADPVLDTRVATPAVQARNHAASPPVPTPVPTPVQAPLPAKP